LGNITVYYKPLNFGVSDSYHDEFIVWTNDAGVKQIIRGGSYADLGFGSESGDGSGVSGVDSPESGFNFPFGSVIVTPRGTYASRTSLDHDQKGTDPQDVIITGKDSELRPYWQKMASEGKKIIDDLANDLSGAPSAIVTKLRAAAAAARVDYAVNRAVENAANPVLALHRMLMTTAARKSISVAPSSRAKRGVNQPIFHSQQVITGVLPDAARQISGQLPVYANFLARTGFDVALAPAVKFAGAAGGLPQTLAPRLGATFLGEVNRRKSKYTGLVQGRPGSLVSELQLSLKNKAAMTPWVAGAAGSAPVFSRLSETKRQTLPSIAPVSRRVRDEVSAEPLVARNADNGLPTAGQSAAPVLPAGQRIDQRQLRGALDELLSRQGRLPPSGGAAFDPLLTPAWPGLQLPV